MAMVVRHVYFLPCVYIVKAMILNGFLLLVPITIGIGVITIKQYKMLGIMGWI